MVPKEAAILVGHGSKARGFEKAMARVARAIRRRGRFRPVVCAYLEINSPSIRRAVDLCVRQKARTVRIVPYFLLTGNHVTRDIPRIVRSVRKDWKGRAKILLCDYLGYDEKIVEVVEKRLKRKAPGR